MQNPFPNSILATIYIMAPNNPKKLLCLLHSLFISHFLQFAALILMFPMKPLPKFLFLVLPMASCLIFRKFALTELIRGVQETSFPAFCRAYQITWMGRATFLFIIFSLLLAPHKRMMSSSICRRDALTQMDFLSGSISLKTCCPSLLPPTHDTDGFCPTGITNSNGKNEAFVIDESAPQTTYHQDEEEEEEEKELVIAIFCRSYVVRIFLAATMFVSDWVLCDWVKSQIQKMHHQVQRVADMMPAAGDA